MIPNPGDLKWHQGSGPGAKKPLTLKTFSGGEGNSRGGHGGGLRSLVHPLRMSSEDRQTLVSLNKLLGSFDAHFFVPCRKSTSSI